MTKKILPFLKGVSGYLLCVAGFLISLAAFYPGFMSDDSLGQWEQGRSWSFTDIHPPLMSALWGITDRIYPGPLGMLLLHNLVFWGALALFWKMTGRKSLWLGIGLICCAFMPQIWPLLGMIWKDVGLGGALLLASALLYSAEKRRAKFFLFASLPLLFYGYAVRWNAAPAILPIALWTGFIAMRILPKRQPESLRRQRVLAIASGLAYFILLTLAVTLSTRLLTHGKTQYPSQQIFLHDLAAISSGSGESQFPAYLVASPDFSMEMISRLYNAASVNSLIYGANPPLKITTEGRNFEELRARWLSTVLTHKAIYLRHRWGNFSNLLGINTAYVYNTYLETVFVNPPEYRPHPSLLDRWMRGYINFFRDTFFFKAYIWILLSAGLLYLSLRGRLREDLEIVFVLTLSGLLFSLTYFFVSPSNEPRYLWWTMLATLIALVFFVRYIINQWLTARGRGDSSRAETPILSPENGVVKQQEAI